MKAARVLVVDDDPGMLRAVERVLTAQHEVLACRSPSEALARTPAFLPEVALLDVRMPEMSGFDLLDALRRRWPDLDVIMMTGSVHSFDTHLVQAIRASAYYFIEKPFDREVLHTLVERCVQVRRLREENRRHTERMERDLRLARTFQHSLLPGEALSVGAWRLAGRYAPCAELGGDFYDYTICDGYVGFLVADVTGHGVGAAMVTGIVKAAFRECIEQQLAPPAVVQRVLAHLRSLSSQRFLSMFCGRVDCGRGVLEYVNAGHPAGVYGVPGSPVTLLESTGTLVSAVLEEQYWELSRARFERGGRLLVFTDGLLDAIGAGEPLGLERVVRAVEQARPGGEVLLDDVQHVIHEHVGRHALTDDIALLSVSHE